MTNQEIIDAVTEWIVAEVPEIGTNTYDYSPAQKPKGLPDVIVEMTEEGIVRDDPDFPLGDLQQTALNVYRLGIAIMVGAGRDDAAHQAAQQTLRDFSQRLKESIVRDHTLGGRVAFASPYHRFDYTPPFVEYEDGTRGREMTLLLAVGDLLTEE